MSDTDILNLEKYALSENKAEVLSTLVPGTDTHYYYTSLSLFSSAKPLTQEDEQFIIKYITKHSTPKSIAIAKKYYAYKIDTAGTPEEVAVNAECLNKLTMNFKFQHLQPSNVTTSSLTQEKIVIPNSLKEAGIDVSLESLIASYYKSDTIEPPRNFEEFVLHSFKISQLFQKNLSTVEYVLSTCKDLTSFQDIPEMLLKFYEEKQKVDKNYTLDESIFKKLSITQLMKLKGLIHELGKNKQFIASLFCKSFKITKELAGASQKEDLVEQRKQLEKMYNWAAQNAPYFYSLKDQLLYAILVNGIDTGCYDKKLFKEYLQKPRKLHAYIPDDTKKTILKNKLLDYDDYWHNVHKLSTNKWISDEKLLEKYLEVFFVEEPDYEEYIEYLSVNFVKEIFYKTKLMKGEEFENISELLTGKQLKNFRKSKELTLSKLNHRFFGPGESVKILIEIKNITQLIIRFFEINTESYYKKNWNQINEKINLDGLIAQDEAHVTFTEPPIRKIAKEFEFDKIKNSDRGIFIVEFIGGGLASRVLIKKGYLSFISHLTVHGHVIEILNEKHEVCKSPQTGIFLENKFHKADAEGRIILPYLTTGGSKRVQMLLCYDNFYELASFELKEEQYEFNCAFMYDEQSLIMGNEAKFIIQPRLYMNSTLVSLSLIENFSVSVVSVNDQQISATQKYEDIALSYQNDVVVSYPIPARVKNIEIKVNASLKGKQPAKTFTATQNISFNIHHEDETIYSLHLQKSTEGYNVFVLGRNGEPLINGILNISLESMYTKKVIDAVLQTNKFGYVELGLLPGVKKIHSRLQESVEIKATSKSWNIIENDGFIINGVLNVCHGSTVRLPHLESSLSEDSYKVVEISVENSEILDSCYEYLKYDEKSNMIILEKLPVGRYKIFYRNLNEVTEINVLDAKYWQNYHNYVLLENSIVSIKEQKKGLLIEGIEFEKDNSVKIKVKSEHLESTKVHVFACDFLSPDAEDKISQVNNNVRSRMREVYRFNKLNNIYLSNKTLNEESCYVLERKASKRYIGNTLEKPQIILKRKQNRGTETGIENLDAGGDFNETDKHDIVFKGEQALREDHSQVRGTKGRYYPCESLLNFLASPCHVATNLTPDEEGIIHLKEIDLKKFSSLQIILTSANGATQKTIPIDKKLLNKDENEGVVNLINKIDVKDLRLKNIKSTGKSYQNSRKAHLLLKDSDLIIKDMTSTEIAIIDDIKKVFELQKEFCRETGVELNGDSGLLNFEFLCEWDKLPDLEKHKKYDKYSCHELNLFLYFKDPAYFEVYIKPFISNKLEKTFIDYIILDQKENLFPYLKIPKINQLNSLELSLLVYSLNETHKQECSEIASWFENKRKLDPAIPETYKKLFDTVLNADNSSQSSAKKSIISNKKQEKDYSMAQVRHHAHYMRVAAPKMASDSSNRNYSYENRAEEDEYCFEDDMNLDYFGDYEEEKVNVIQGFKNVDQTKEYIERRYYLQTTQPNTSMVSVNDFWLDFIKHLTGENNKKPFLSMNFIYCNKTLTDIISTLAILSLSFSSIKCAYNSYEGIGAQIHVSNESIIFVKELNEGKSENLNLDIMIIQRFFDPKDRYDLLEDMPNIRIEKKIDEYVKSKVYGSQIIVANSTISSHEIQVVYEVPQGSIPVKLLDYTKAHNVVLNSYQTYTLEFYFYFPEKGTYHHYPATVSKDGRIINSVKSETFEVLEQKQKVNLNRIEDILSRGSQNDIINFLETKNILNSQIFKFQDIYWLLKQKSFYSSVLQVLRKKKIFDRVAWSYSILHGDIEGIKELYTDLVNEASFREGIYYWKTNSISYDTFSVFEYYPIVNSRVHKIGNESTNNILNYQFKERYKGFLNYIVDKGTFENKDRLILTYYLLLQDRIEESINIFQKIKKTEIDNLDAQLQYDYLEAYLDFYNGYPNFVKAREILEKYLAYPVISWRNLFIDLANQLAEFDGEEMIKVDKDESEQSRTKQNNANAQVSETLSLEISGAQLKLTCQNISSVSISIYKIDLEVLFSRNPFLLQGVDDFSHVQPHEVIEKKLESSPNVVVLTIDIPEMYHKHNLFIQAKTSGLMRSITYFSTSLKVQLNETLGHVKVMDCNLKALSKIYVKTYAQNKSGATAFYKDGYTDIRGTFDYASLNTSNLNDLQKFSLLIMSDELGALIKEVTPPIALGKLEGKVVDVKFGKYLKRQNSGLIRQSENYTRLNCDAKK